MKKNMVYKNTVKYNLKYLQDNWMKNLINSGKMLTRLMIDYLFLSLTRRFLRTHYNH